MRIKQAKGTRALASAAIVALLSVGLGLAGGQPASAAPGVFITAGSITTFTVPSWIATAVDPAARILRVRANGGAGRTATGVGAFGGVVQADVPVGAGGLVGSGQNLYVTVGRNGGGGGAPGFQGVAGSPGGGESDISKCITSCTGFGTASDPRMVIAGGGGGDGGAGAAPANSDGGFGGAVSGPGAAPVVPRCVSGANGTNGTGVVAANGGLAGHAPVCAAPGSNGGTPGTGGAAVSGGAAGTNGALNGHGGAGGSSPTQSGGGGGGGGGAGYLGGGGGSSGGSGGAGGGGGGSGSSFAAAGTQNVGFGTAGISSPFVSISYVPGAPTGISTEPGEQSISVGWTAPADPGGNSVIDSYKAVACAAAVCTTSVVGPNARTATIAGLANGTRYTVTVTAHNAIGDGAPGIGPDTTAGPPGTPTITATGTSEVIVAGLTVSGPVASFTTNVPAQTSSFTGTIDWGDGSTSSGSGANTIRRNSNGTAWIVDGTHTYATPGIKTVTTTVTNPGFIEGTATTRFHLFVCPQSGCFVVGNNAASPFTFYGATWSARNPMSGGIGPATFKGFETSLRTQQSCSDAGDPKWTQSGNPSPPSAAALKAGAEMLVVVASKVTNSGSVFSGNTFELYALRVTTYSPTGIGTGTLLAVACQGG